MLSDRFTESMEVTIASKTQIVIAIETKHFQHWVALHVIQNELGATTPKEVVPTQSEFLEMWITDQVLPPVNGYCKSAKLNNYLRARI